MLVTHQPNDTQEGDESQATFAALLREKLLQAVRIALSSVLEAEVDAFISAVRYERNEQRRDYDLLCVSEGPLEDDPHEQCDRAAL